MKDKYRFLGLALATIGVWMGVGIATFSAPEQATQIAGAGAMATIFIWLFGT